MTDTANGRSATVRVYMDGCFDLIHYGHCNALRQAKQEGDILVAGIHSDEDIARHKGPPVFTESERYQLVSRIRWVDEIVTGATYLPDPDLLLKYNCDFCVHGDDVAITCDGHDAYESLRKRNKYRECKRTESVSTTYIIDRILHPEARISLSVCDVLDRLRMEAADMGMTLQRRLYFKGSEALANGEFYSLKFITSSNDLSSTEQHGIYVAGDFDLFHVGHAEFLEAALKEGDYLSLGVFSDDIVRNKKGQPPVMNLYERVLMVLHIKGVSEVIVNPPDTITKNFLETLGPHICYCSASNDNDDDGDNDVNGDNGDSECSDSDEKCKKLGGFKTINITNSITSEEIKRRILSRRELYTKRNAQKNNIQT